MNYSTFYEIAEYGNEAWKGGFSHSEVAENAHNYTCDFEWSREHGDVANSIKELAKLLAEDGSEECMDWLYDIADELGLIDMDYLDYMDTDPEIIKRILTEQN